MPVNDGDEEVKLERADLAVGQEACRRACQVCPETHLAGKRSQDNLNIPESGDDVSLFPPDECLNVLYHLVHQALARLARGPSAMGGH